jgi:hypothetical protein
VIPASALLATCLCWLGDGAAPVPLRALPLSPRAPEGVEAVLAGAAAPARFGQIRYGGPGTVRVAFALVEPKPGAHALYLDANRDRRLDEQDLVPGPGPEWRTRLGAMLESGARAERTVVFRLGAAGTVLGFATVDQVKSQVALGERTVAAVRRDGDGNGLFADERDRVWFDLDGDGQEDPVRETFPCLPVLELLGRRWVLRADGLGAALELQPLDAMGKVVLAPRLLGQPADQKAIQALTVTLRSKDGVIAGLHEPGAETEIPAGSYRITNLVVTLADPGKGQPWTYVFSADGDDDHAAWHEVGGATPLSLDPLGAVTFAHGLAGAEAERAGRDTLWVQPKLRTGDGLLVNSCSRGETERTWGGEHATIELRAAAGTRLQTATSGFA